MSRWAALSANGWSVFGGTSGLHGPSRAAPSQRLAFSRTHVDPVIAGRPGPHPGLGVPALQEPLRGRGRVAA